MSQNVGPRRIILDLAVTLDGFIEGKTGKLTDVSWTLRWVLFIS
jgi:hypothetical protein